MQNITFSQKSCLNANTVRANQQQFGGRADLSRLNSLANPLGQAPARGTFALSKADLDDLDADGLHTLVFDDKRYGKVAAYNLVITEEPIKAYSTSIGASVHGNAAYVVKVADQRWLCHNPYYHISINKQYNVRARGWAGYYDASRNSGSDWTWATMIEDIWDLLTPLGEFPGLPITPGGTPEGWQFIGGSAWLALCEVLDHIGCAVNWNPMEEENPYTIVQVGATDETMERDLDKLINRKIYDADFTSVVRGRVPYGVRVFFNKQWEVHGTEPTTQKTSGQWQTSSVHSIDVVGPDSAKAQSGVYHPIWSDVSALYNASGSLTNSSALTDAADEEADNYYRMLREGGGRLHRTYDGIAKLSPGSSLRGVAWYVGGQGELLTDIVRHPFKALKVGDGPDLFEEVEHSSNNQPPVLRPQFPNVQPLEQVIEIANGTPSGGLYDCTIQRVTTAPSTWTDQESIWGVDLNGATSLTAGAKYKARLVSYHNSRPVYAFRSASGVEIGIVEIVDGVRGRDEIQLVDLSSGTASGGTFTLGYVTSSLPSNVTANIAWNASSSTVQTQVRTLWGWESATVTGSDINAGYTITNPVRTAYQALEIDDALLTGTTPVGQVTRTQESLRAVFDATLQTLTEPITDDQSFPFATGDSVWVRDLRDKWGYSGRSVLKVGRKYLAQRIGTDLYYGRPLYSIDSAGDQLSNHIRAYTTTTQNIVTGSYTKIEWDGVYEDTQSSWDAGNPTYFTLQDNSWLHDIHLTVYWAATANDGGSRLARLGSASSATDAIIVDGMPTEPVIVPGFHTASTYGQVTQHEWKSVKISQHNDKQIAIWLRTENNNLDITGAYLVIREVGFRPYPINLP